MGHGSYRMRWYSQYWVEEALDYLLPIAAAVASVSLVAYLFHR